MKIRVKIAAFAAAFVISAAAVSSNVFPYTSASAYTSEDLEVVTFGHLNAKSSLNSIQSSLYYSSFSHYSVPVLKKSRTLKKNFVLKENQTLIIPSGKTLTLMGGSEINGNIYIEKGGKLVIEKYSTSVSGTIICDGTLFVTAGTLYSKSDSLIFIGESGEFIAADRGINGYDELNGRIGGDASTVVCLGKTNIPNPTYRNNPLVAVFTRMEFDGGKYKVSTVTENIKDLYPSKIGYNTSREFGYGGFYDIYTILFDGGGCVIFKAQGDKSYGWSQIGNIDMHLVMLGLDVYRDLSIVKEIEDLNRF